MTVQTGRTVPDWAVLKIGSAASDMQDMKIDEIGDIGLDYPEVEMFSHSDAGARGAISGKVPEFVLEFGGPVDNTATTGPSTLLRAWNGQNTLLSFDYQMGMRHAWESGEQQFGYTGVIATNSGLIITSYKENAGRYKSRGRMTTGAAAAPAWGVAAETKPA